MCTVHNDNARGSPVLSDTTFPRLDMPTSEGLPQRWRLRTKKLAKIRVRFLTVNIGTMTGKSREVAEMLKRRHVEIACVQETKWKGKKQEKLEKDTSFTTVEHQRPDMELASSYTSNDKTRSWK